MVKKSKIPQALLRYVQMSESELHDIMDKNPYYTLPKIAYMIKTHHGIDEDNMELYAYDISAIKELMAIHIEHLNDKVAERKSEREHVKEVEVKTSSSPIEPTQETEQSTIIENQSKDALTVDKSSQVISKDLSEDSLTSKKENPAPEEDLILFDIDNHEIAPEKQNNSIESNSSDIIDLTEPIHQEVEMNATNETPKIDSELDLTNDVSNQEIEVSKDNNSQPLEEANKTKADEKSNSTQNEMDFFSWLNSTQPSPLEKKKPEPSQLETEDLEEVVLDPYYQNQIRSKEHKSDLTVEEKAKISVKKTDLVSETLAKLYSEQGEIKKAKEMYLKLIDMFPEKSTYFASLIKKLNS